MQGPPLPAAPAPVRGSEDSSNPPRVEDHNTPKPAQRPPPSPRSYSDSEDPDDAPTAGDVHTPAGHVVALGLGDTLGGGEVVEEEAAAVGRAGSGRGSWVG